MGVCVCVGEDVGTERDDSLVRLIESPPTSSTSSSSSSGQQSVPLTDSDTMMSCTHSERSLQAELRSCWTCGNVSETSGLCSGERQICVYYHATVSHHPHVTTDRLDEVMNDVVSGESSSVNLTTATHSHPPAESAASDAGSEQSNESTASDSAAETVVMTTTDADVISDETHSERVTDATADDANAAAAVSDEASSVTSGTV